MQGTLKPYRASVVGCPDIKPPIFSHCRNPLKDVGFRKKKLLPHTCRKATSTAYKISCFPSAYLCWCSLVYLRLFAGILILQFHCSRPGSHQADCSSTNDLSSSQCNSKKKFTLAVSCSSLEFSPQPTRLQLLKPHLRKPTTHWPSLSGLPNAFSSKSRHRYRFGPIVRRPINQHTSCLSL